MNKTWRTWDRDPDPGFRDYTILAYKNRVIHDFDFVLDYTLTRFLNQINFEPSDNNLNDEDIQKVKDAYLQFENQAEELSRDTAQKIKILENNKTKKINELGLKIANQLQTGIKKEIEHNG